MRRLYLIGIGAGHPEHITVQAIAALNKVDVFFVLDKGSEKQDLVRARRAICETYARERPWRMIVVPDAERDRAPAAYAAAVKDWHERRAALLETMIAAELGENDAGAILIWGDPAIYDSALRIVEAVRARGSVAFDYEIIPGISSVQALAAAHRISLNAIGGATHFITGRELAAGLPASYDNVVVMLDGQCAFKSIDPKGIDIYWGAYVGTSDEILVSGDLVELADDIVRLRTEARARKGWIMDIYLLRRRAGGQ